MPDADRLSALLCAEITHRLPPYRTPSPKHWSTSYKTSIKAARCFLFALIHTTILNITQKPYCATAGVESLPLIFHACCLQVSSSVGYRVIRNNALADAFASSWSPHLFQLFCKQLSRNVCHCAHTQWPSRQVARTCIVQQASTSRQWVSSRRNEWTHCGAAATKSRGAGSAGCERAEAGARVLL